MPYSDISQLPSFVKKYSKKLQRQYLYVFNSVYKKVLKEKKNVVEAEKSAFKAANSVLKKRFLKKDSMENNTRDDYFFYLIDKWLNNLVG